MSCCDRLVFLGFNDVCHYDNILTSWMVLKSGMTDSALSDHGLLTISGGAFATKNLFYFDALPEYLPQVCYPEELVLLGGHVEVGRLLVDKEGVGHPDLVDVVGRHDKLGDSVLKFKSGFNIK